jgi:hypothetical protein
MVPPILLHIGRLVLEVGREQLCRKIVGFDVEAHALLPSPIHRNWPASAVYIPVLG